ncbi:MAG: ADP-ribosylglycohydrolase family protein [Arachnia sp.]
MTIALSDAQRDRAAGVLLGQAVGDALGVPYEFAPRIPVGTAEMIGGGLGPYAPGEWSDDTQMAACIALVTATGADLTTDEGLDAVAQRFLQWRLSGATDIGNQTRHVIDAAREGHGLLSRRMIDESLAQAALDKAGNGALMRTGVVGLVALDDRERTARCATRVASLTHAHPQCVASSILWSEAVRVAVIDSVLDIRAGLDLLPATSRAPWEAWITEAETTEPNAFSPNGWTVAAFQAAWSSIHATRHLDGSEHVQAALHSAVAIGNDTDTVAAIAGALLGACYGASAIPTAWVDAIHGWPGLRAADLRRLAQETADPTL